MISQVKSQLVSKLTKFRVGKRVPKRVGKSCYNSQALCKISLRLEVWNRFK